MDEKKLHIFTAAADVFMRYGIRKTSMQDLADAASMSRAALYLHFRSKEDLFRSLMEWHHGVALTAAEAAFDTPAPFISQLETALADFTTALMGPVRASAHGVELFEANMTLAGDITQRTSAHLHQLIETAVSTGVARGALSLTATGLSPAALTDLITVCVDGIKKAPEGLDRLDERLHGLMRLVEIATRAGSGRAANSTP